MVGAGPTVTVSTLAAGNETVVVKDSEDDTLYSVTAKETASGNEVAFAGVSTITVSNYTDLSGNAGQSYSKVVSFVADDVDPKVVSTKVEKIDGVEHLIVTFDENVVPQNGKDIDGKVVIDYVEDDATTITTDTTANTGNFELYKPVGGKSKSVQLDLSALVAGDYTLDLPVGLVKDASDNDSEAKIGVKFTRTSDTDTDKPALVAAYDGNGIQVDSNTSLTVKFNKKLDVATALNVNNYVIEGVTVKSAIFTKNDAAEAIVRLTLEEGSVTLSGSRTVTIKNVKSADGVAMDTVVTSETFTENVKPTVKSAALTTEKTITVTFSEKVALGTGVDFDVFVGNETDKRELASVDGEELAADGKSVVITLNTALNADDLGKEIVVKRATTNDVKDTPAGNALSFTSIVVTK